MPRASVPTRITGTALRALLALLALLAPSGGQHYDYYGWQPESVPRGRFYGREPQCVDIPADMQLCYDVGYKRMRLPNLLEHESMAEAKQQASSWVPLLAKQCHTDTQLFLCSLFAPVCLDRPVYPCRSLCEVVRDSCAPVMESYGFPWPEMLHCAKFPSDHDLCIAVQFGNSQATPPPGKRAGHGDRGWGHHVGCHRGAPIPAPQGAQPPGGQQPWLSTPCCLHGAAPGQQGAVLGVTTGAVSPHHVPWQQHKAPSPERCTCAAPSHTQDAGGCPLGQGRDVTQRHTRVGSRHRGLWHPPPRCHPRCCAPEHQQGHPTPCPSWEAGAGTGCPQSPWHSSRGSPSVSPLSCPR